MASFHEHGGNSDQDIKPVPAYAVAERRKAALAEVDRAKFSQVVSLVIIIISLFLS